MSTTIGPMGPIDTIDYRSWNGSTPTPGPFEWNGNRYLVLGRTVTDGILRIWKSSDDGVTWSNFDSPTVSSITFARQGSLPSKIALASMASSGGSEFWVLEEFDMATDTFVSVANVTAPLYDSGPAVPTLLDWMDYSPVTDEWRLYYRLTVPTRLMVKRYQGADLGSVALATYPIGYHPISDIQSMSDPLGNTLIVYQEIPGNKKLSYVRMAVDGSVGSSTEIYDEVADPWPGHPAIVNGKVVIPYSLWDVAEGAYRAAAFVGDDYTDPTPSFASMTLSVNYAANVTTGTNGSLWWLATATPAPDYDTLDQVEMRTFDGTTLGPIELIHDEIANPSFPLVPFQFLFSLSPPVYKTDDGSYEWTMSQEYFVIGQPIVRCGCGFFWRLIFPAVASGLCLASYDKHPSDVLDLTIDWSRWLVGDTITSSSWAGGGLTIPSSGYTDTTTTVRISGGVNGTTYLPANTITTSAGRTEVKTLRVIVKEAVGGPGIESGWTTGSPS